MCFFNCIFVPVLRILHRNRGKSKYWTNRHGYVISTSLSGILFCVLMLSLQLTVGHDDFNLDNQYSRYFLGALVSSVIIYVIALDFQFYGYFDKKGGRWLHYPHRRATIVYLTVLFYIPAYLTVAILGTVTMANMNIYASATRVLCPVFFFVNFVWLLCLMGYVCRLSSYLDGQWKRLSKRPAQNPVRRVVRNEPVELCVTEFELTAGEISNNGLNLQNVRGKIIVDSVGNGVVVMEGRQVNIDIENWAD